MAPSEWRAARPLFRSSHSPGPHVERAPETPAVPGLPQPLSGPVTCRRLALCLAMQPQGPGDLGQSRTRLTDRVGVALT